MTQSLLDGNQGIHLLHRHQDPLQFLDGILHPILVQIQFEHFLLILLPKFDHQAFILDDNLLLQLNLKYHLDHKLQLLPHRHQSLNLSHPHFPIC